MGAHASHHRSADPDYCSGVTSQERSVVDVRSAEFVEAPVGCLARMRAQGATCPTTDGWLVVTSHELAKRVLTDPATFSSRISKHSAPPAEIAEHVAKIRAQGWPYTSALGGSDAPVHAKHRQMVNRAFTPRALKTLEPLVRVAADDLARGLPVAEEFDFQAQFGEPLPVWAISRVLGLPIERRNDIRRWSTAAVATIGANPTTEDWLRYETDLLDFQHAMVEVLERNRIDPQPGVIAELAQVIAEEDGDAAEGVQMSLLLTLLRELVVAGNETTGKFIAESEHSSPGSPAVAHSTRSTPTHRSGTECEPNRTSLTRWSRNACEWRRPHSPRCGSSPRRRNSMAASSNPGN